MLDPIWQHVKFCFNLTEMSDSEILLQSEVGSYRKATYFLPKTQEHFILMYLTNFQQISGMDPGGYPPGGVQLYLARWREMCPTPHKLAKFFQGRACYISSYKNITGIGMLRFAEDAVEYTCFVY